MAKPKEKITDRLCNLAYVGVYTEKLDFTHFFQSNEETENEYKIKPNIFLLMVCINGGGKSQANNYLWRLYRRLPM
uniref:Uncharacterized protein n=1 Tax=Romanomermis culicivorax TaxID=13658 RepID=A0A915JX29_ROMCU